MLSDLSVRQNYATFAQPLIGADLILIGGGVRENAAIFFA